ncbi:MAG: chalcone isomerase family protein [Planctomycetota bacterium]|jgi:hypothetical protein|nr:chalcone isomerase family protein [Planctomycetota bacterium]
MISTVALAFFPAALFAQEAPAVKVEPRTELEFAQVATWPGSKTSQTLLGVGVRDKTFLRVKVYALGLYVDPVGAAKALDKWQETSVKKMQKDNKFYDALLNGKFSKTMRWVFVRDVDGEDIAEAFEDSLEPRLKTLAKNEKGKKGSEARAAAAKTGLKTLKSWFTEEIEDGQELVFAWHPGGKLIVQLEGKLIGELTSEHVSTALFDTAIGEDTVAEDAREDFPTGVSMMFEIASQRLHVKKGPPEK